MINKIELKKILRDYNYLYETLHDIKEISADAETKFRDAMIKSGDNEALSALIPDEKDSKKIEEVKASEESPISHNDIDFKKLFRKIVVKCHPDKNREANSSELSLFKECYENANVANETYDWGLLIRTANKLDMDFSDLNISISEIKRKNEELQSEINRYENSMAFQWYTQDDEMQKENFLNYCLGIFRESRKN